MVKTLSDIPCDVLKGVGQKVADNLKAHGIASLEDLLFHLPLRYQDRTRITPIADLRHGVYAVVEGAVQSSRIQFGKRRSLIVQLADKNGDVLQLRFFHFSKSQQAGLATGTELRAFGQAREWSRQIEMIHPEYQVQAIGEIPEVEEHLTPIYPQLGSFSQKMIRKLVDQALGYLANHEVEPLVPEAWLIPISDYPLKEALQRLHQPDPTECVDALDSPAHPARVRLACEELIAQRLALRQARLSKAIFKARVLAGEPDKMAAFDEALPFKYTTPQQKVIHEIETDLSGTQPMQRLLQGDVGSGKTVVAARSALQAISSGAQVAVMAPTEILAEQLFSHFREWLEPIGYRVDFLTGSMKVRERRGILENLALGLTHVIVGTHALFQEAVKFKTLGLVIIDEQHRFGVKQRLALQQKGEAASRMPHQLVMTATPIPRSLAMTAYAELDLSIIDGLPPGRTPIKTVAFENGRRDEVIERIRHVCSEGQQVYWVCTLIEESETMQCRAATDTWRDLQSKLTHQTVGLVHGQMRSEDKDAIMQSFKRGEVDVLVATTVIEVGVNVPNASLMVIENPERLGLSQLHQLRGRVGRGSLQSFCVFLYQKPLNAIAKRRLAVMRETTDGFKIADEDLKIRGPGDFLGTQQTGVAQFRVADLTAHQGLLPKIREVCERLEQTHPERMAAVIHRWYRDAEEYAKV